MGNKYCEDCKHFYAKQSLETGKCLHPESRCFLSKDPEKENCSFASTMRISGCGKEGKLFEPKEGGQDGME
jgi:hypothetical protein